MISIGLKIQHQIHGRSPALTEGWHKEARVDLPCFTEVRLNLIAFGIKLPPMDSTWCNVQNVVAVLSRSAYTRNGHRKDQSLNSYVRFRFIIKSGTRHPGILFSCPNDGAITFCLLTSAITCRDTSTSFPSKITPGPLKISKSKA